MPNYMRPSADIVTAALNKRVQVLIPGSFIESTSEPAFRTVSLRLAYGNYQTSKVSEDEVALSDSQVLVYAADELAARLRAQMLKDLGIAEVEMTEGWQGGYSHGAPLEVDLLSDSTIRMDAVEFRKLVATFGYRFMYNMPKSKAGADKLQTETQAVVDRYAKGIYTRSEVKAMLDTDVEGTQILLQQGKITVIEDGEV